VPRRTSYSGEATTRERHRETDTHAHHVALDHVTMANASVVAEAHDVDRHVDLDLGTGR
jgi:hypothetical protein